jgi:hypothetical protein
MMRRATIKINGVLAGILTETELPEVEAPHYPVHYRDLGKK